MDHDLQTDRAAVLATVLSVLARVLGRDLPATSEDTALLDGLGLDSTQVLELLMDLEDSLSVEFDIDTLEQSDVETIGSLTDYVAGAMSRMPL